MAITTLDGALAGMQATQTIAKAASLTLGVGKPVSLWYLGGAPGAGAAPTLTTAGGVALSSSSTLASNIAGQIPHIDPGSGNSYLGRLSACASQPGLLLLCDRLLHDGAVAGGTQISVTTTTIQTITTATLPARDNTGTTGGYGVQCGIEIAATMGVGLATPTLTYNAAGGATGRTSTLIDPVVASSGVGSFYRFGLQAGDAGIAVVTGLTNTVTWTSGTIILVLYRVLAAIELPGAYIPNAIDALTAGFPQLFNGVVPFFIFVPSTAAALNLTGSYTETQG